MFDGVHFRQAFPGGPARDPDFSDAENRYAKILEKLCALEPAAWCKKAVAALRQVDGSRAELAGVAACNASGRRIQKSCADTARNDRESYESARRDCQQKQPGACRRLGETLYLDARELRPPNLHARRRLDRALDVFEDECRLRGLTTAVLGPGTSLAPPQIIEPLRPGDDRKAARQRALRRAMKEAALASPEKEQEALDDDVVALAIARGEYSACLLTYLRAAEARRQDEAVVRPEASGSDAGTLELNPAARIRFGL